MLGELFLLLTLGDWNCKYYFANQIFGLFLYSNTFTISMGKQTSNKSKKNVFVGNHANSSTKKTENTVEFSRHSAYNDHDNGELWWPRCSIVKFKKKS